MTKSQAYNIIKEFGFISFGGKIKAFDSIGKTHFSGGFRFRDCKRKRLVAYRVSDGVMYIKLFSKPTAKQMKVLYKIRLPITFEWWDGEDFFDGEDTEISFINFSKQVLKIWKN